MWLGLPGERRRRLRRPTVARTEAAAGERASQRSWRSRSSCVRFRHEPTARLALLDEALGLRTELGRARSAAGRGGSGASVAANRRDAAWAEPRSRSSRSRLSARAAHARAGVLTLLAPGGTGGRRFRTLGGFAVVRDGRTVELSEWRSRKARDVLKFLVSRRGRPVPVRPIDRGALARREPRPLSNRLAVAVATLRGVLDPGRRHGSDRYIGGDQEALWIQPGGAAIDVDLFLADATAALALVARGPRIPKLSDCSWSLRRHTAATSSKRTRIPTGPRRLGSRRGAPTSPSSGRSLSPRSRGDVEAAARYRLRLLERDPYDEEAPPRACRRA